MIIYFIKVYFALQNSRVLHYWNILQHYPILRKGSFPALIYHTRGSNPQRMLLLSARLIKIKSWAVSCAKRRVGCGPEEQSILQEQETCVSWPQNNGLI